jgi:hypothetical protein
MGRRVVAGAIGAVFLLAVLEVSLLAILEWGNTRKSAENFPARGAPVDAARKPEIPAVKILSYGDSIARGFGLKESEASYSKLLEQKINESGARPHEVIAERVGSSPTHYFLRLGKDLARYKPEMLAVEIELSNDLSDEALLTWRDPGANGLPGSIGGGRYRMAWNNRTVLGGVSFGNPFDRTVTYSFVSAGFGALLSDLFPNPIFSPEARTYYYNVGYDRHFITPERLQTAFEHLFLALGAMKEMAAQSGARFVALILPSRHAFSDGPFREGARDLVRRAEERARSIGLPYLSLTDVEEQRGGKSLFLDFCHPNPEGHRIIADVLFDYWKKAQ